MDNLAGCALGCLQHHLDMLNSKFDTAMQGKYMF